MTIAHRIASARQMLPELGAFRSGSMSVVRMEFALRDFADRMAVAAVSIHAPRADGRGERYVVLITGEQGPSTPDQLVALLTGAKAARSSLSRWQLEQPSEPGTPLARFPMPR